MTGGTTTTSHAKYALYWKSSQKGDFVFSTLVVSNYSTYLRYPQKIELMLPQIFQVGSQKTPPGLRFPIMMQVLCHDELSWFQEGFFALCSFCWSRMRSRKCPPWVWRPAAPWAYWMPSRRKNSSMLGLRSFSCAKSLQMGRCLRRREIIVEQKVL